MSDRQREQRLDLIALAAIRAVLRGRPCFSTQACEFDSSVPFECLHRDERWKLEDR